MRILFVCMGNICRSPLVEAVARHEFAKVGLDVEVASAGTEDYHAGAGADPRAIRVAEQAGYRLADHRARRVSIDDFGQFDHLLAMDRTNLRRLGDIRPRTAALRPQLFLQFAGIGRPVDVPDPYRGSAADFTRSLDLARLGVAGLIRRLQDD